MPKVFITGIEGFVGSHLARHLHSRGYEVSGLFFVAPLADFSYARIRYCDIRDAAQLEPQLAEAKPDCVVHLAATSSVAIAEQDFGGTMDVNVKGTLRLLDAIHRLTPASRVLLISSSEVYDRTGSSPARLEETSPIKPMNNYAFSKLMAEQVGQYFTDRHGMDIVTLRPFSHTGPGQNTNFVFPSVARQIAEVEEGRREPEIEVGNTSVSRDYTDIRDVCRAYELALTKAQKGEVYNVTSEQIMRIGEGIEYLVSLSRIPIAVKVAPGRQRQEGTLLAGSSAKFRAATGWQSEIDIKQTLKDLLDYQRVLVRDLV
jgi:GDP-4-dehydro-6-deoxy-D-mannose reductase